MTVTLRSGAEPLLTIESDPEGAPTKEAQAA